MLIFFSVVYFLYSLLILSFILFCPLWWWLPSPDSGLNLCLDYIPFQVTGHFYQKMFRIFTWNLLYFSIDEYRSWWVMIFFFCRSHIALLFHVTYIILLHLYIYWFGYLLVEIWNDEAVMESSIEALKILKAELTYDPAIPLPHRPVKQVESVCGGNLTLP